eukprot:COSAG02_NODE_40922_length_400_cov_0.594684_1_plen_28_part_10
MRMNTLRGGKATACPLHDCSNTGGDQPP